MTRPFRFLHRDQHFIDIDAPIPIYIAANGPRALRVTGEFGDGRTTLMYEDSSVLAHHISLILQGASNAGRTLPAAFHVAAVSAMVILRASETLASERIIDACGAWVTTALHFVYEIHALSGDDRVIPPAFHAIWEQYCAYVEQMQTPAAKRYLQLHDGHSTYLVPCERRFVTPEAIQATSLVGKP